MQRIIFFSGAGLLLVCLLSLGSFFIPLREKASFPVGVAVSPQHLANPRYAEVVAREFSSLTAENVMKPQYVWTGEHQYSFAKGDSIVSFAQKHDMQVHGHTLVWHQMRPAWLHVEAYDSATLENLLRDYIQAVVRHFKGKVVSWDVVNEAVDPEGNGMRKSVYQQKLGDGYVARCYQYAREADPDVLLFYNDYDLETKPEKLKAVLAMIDNFQERGIPINGIGLQMHINVNVPIEQMQHAMDEIIRRGLKIHFSEVDIKVNPEGTATAFTPALAQLQKEKMKAIVQTFNALPDENKFAITFWGLRDNESWLNHFTGHPQWPLLFDENYQPKPMYEGFLEGLE